METGERCDSGVVAQTECLREGDGDDDVVEGEALVLEFILDVDVACAVIRGCGPAVDYASLGKHILRTRTIHVLDSGT